MREFEPVECPKCKRHVDPEEYDEVDETCDTCRADRDIRRHLYQVSTPDGGESTFYNLVDDQLDTDWPDLDILETSAAALAEMDPKDLPWGGDGSE